MDMGRKDFWNGCQLQNAKRASIVNDSDRDWYISQCNTYRQKDEWIVNGMGDRMK